MVKDNENLCRDSKMITANKHTSQLPEDYRRLPIVPDLLELLCGERPYIRKNIVDGVYENADQYLDVRCDR